MRAVLLALGLGGSLASLDRPVTSFLVERHQASEILVLEAFGNERCSSRPLIGTSARPFRCFRRKAR